MENVDQVNSGPGLVAALWRHRALVAAVTALAALAGYGLSLMQPTLYEGQAKLLLSDPRGKSVFQPDQAQPVVLDPSRSIRNRAEVVASRPVVTRAATELGRSRQVDLLMQRVSAVPSAELDLITVHALDPTPKGAAALADAVAQAYQSVAAQQVAATARQTLNQLDRSNRLLKARIARLDQQVKADPEKTLRVSERDAAAEQLATGQKRADQIAVEAALLGSGVDYYERAKVPTSPAQPHSFGAALLAAILGFLGVGAFAWWRAEHTQVANGRQDAVTVLGTSLLGEVPEFSSVGVTGSTPALTAPKSAAGEAYQFLVASLEFSLSQSSSQSSGRTVLVTSAGPTDGKTVTALNLAVSATRDGRRVLLVDADERARGLTELTGVPPSPGLTDLAGGELPLGACVSDYRLSDDQRLPVVPAGSALDEPAGFFRSPGFRKAIASVKEQADLVVVDSPPLLAVADTSAIASQADGIVVVVSRGTRLRVLEEVRERLEFIGTPVLGYVFNRADLRRGRASYGRYGRYGRYGYGRRGEAGASSNGDRADGGSRAERRVRQ